MGIQIKERKKYVIYKNLKRHRQLNARRMKITTCTGNFFRQNNIFFNGSQRPENCKNQEINRIKSKKINRTVKLCTLATNNLILS